MNNTWSTERAAVATPRSRGENGSSPSEESPASSAGMLVGLAPWLLFSFMTHRVGVDAAGYAALAAALLGSWLTLRNGRDGGWKILDVSGVLLFALLAVAAFAGGSSSDVLVADYGRAAATFVLAAVMLASVIVVPFTEQYARESVPRHYWKSPAFRATNRKISAAWGVAVLIMAGGHMAAAVLDPTSNPQPGLRAIDLVCNWVLPAALIAVTVRYSNTVAAAAGTTSPDAVR